MPAPSSAPSSAPSTAPSAARSAAPSTAVSGLRRWLRAGAGLTFPFVPDDYLQLVNPLWSSRELRGKVLEVRRETANAATLVIEPGWGWPHEHVAGQYVGIGVKVDGRFHWRSYSLTSPPQPRTIGGRRTIEITVKAMPEGFVSSHLVDGLAPGTLVRLAAPAGDFVLPEPLPSQILFVTAGSGLTPVMAMLRTLDRRATRDGGALPDVVLLHSAPHVGEVLFREELLSLAERHAGFRLIERHTDTEGLLDLAQLSGVVPDWEQREAWACGPAGMLSALEALWRGAGIAERLHLERFSVDLEGAGGEGGTVTFRSSGRSAAVDGATTLLLAGEALGVPMPFGCRMGICQSCVVPLVAGATRDLRSGIEHVAGERVQTCISAAAGDCAFDL